LVFGVVLRARRPRAVGAGSGCCEDDASPLVARRGGHRHAGARGKGRPHHRRSTLGLCRLTEIYRFPATAARSRRREQPCAKCTARAVDIVCAKSFAPGRQPDGQGRGKLVEKLLKVL